MLAFTIVDQCACACAISHRALTSEPPSSRWSKRRFGSKAEELRTSKCCPLCSESGHRATRCPAFTKPEGVEIVGHRAYTSNSQEADHEDHSHQRRAVSDKYQPSIHRRSLAAAACIFWTLL